MGRTMEFAQLDLPIFRHKTEIAKLLREERKLIITSEPGTGKSTIIPLIAHQTYPGQKIVVLVPRRIIATSLAAYLKKLTKTEKTNEIAYHIGHEKTSDPGTVIEFVSYGVFVLRLLQDQDLAGVSTVIFDEFHERHIDSDLALSFCLDILESLKPELRLVVMSATLNLEALKKLLDNQSKVAHLHVDGRNFEVEIEYQKPPLGAEFFKNRFLFFDHVAKVVRDEQKRTEADILVFLPGLFEIRQVAKRLQNVEVIILHSSSTNVEIQRAFEKPRSTRLILSSSLAESSLTLPFVEIVIDSGLVRQGFYDIHKKRDRLVSDVVSKANAHQRAGRAGRVAKGVCIRLWDSALALESDIKAESERSDLAPMALHLASWQRADLVVLRALSQPNPRLWAEARQTLLECNFIDQDGVLIKQGLDQNARALHPRLQYLWSRYKNRSSVHKNCALLVIGLVLIEDQVRVQGAVDFSYIEQSFDHATRLTLRRLGTLEKVLTDRDSLEIFVELCAQVFGLAKKVKAGEYSLSDGLVFKLDASTQEYIIPLNILVTQDRATAQNWIDLDEALVKNLIASIPFETTVQLKDQCLVCKKTKKLGVFVFSEVGVAYEKSYEILAKKAVIDLLVASGLEYFCDNETLSLLDRYKYCLSQDPMILRDPNRRFDRVDGKTGESLLPYFQFGQDPIISKGSIIYSFKDFCRDGFDIDLEAPKYLHLPNGKKVAIEYPKTGNDLVIVAMRLQDAFGFKSHPKVGGRELTLELLSPAMRPIQRTSNILQFWEGSYKEVRKDMRGRYPKHKWPENPLELD